jgi:hypothetical protein
LPNLRGDKATDYLKQQGLYSSLQEAMAATRYQAEWQSPVAPDGSGGAYELRNEAHSLRAYVSTTGFQVGSLGGDRQRSWQLGMRLKGYGYGNNLSSITTGEIAANQNRVQITQHSALSTQR